MSCDPSPLSRPPNPTLGELVKTQPAPPHPTPHHPPPYPAPPPQVQFDPVSVSTEVVDAAEDCGFDGTLLSLVGPQARRCALWGEVGGGAGRGAGWGAGEGGRAGRQGKMGCRSCGTWGGPGQCWALQGKACLSFSRASVCCLSLPPPPPPQVVRLQVLGMACALFSGAVDLIALEGVASVAVSLMQAAAEAHIDLALIQPVGGGGTGQAVREKYVRMCGQEQNVWIPVRGGFRVWG